MILFNVKIFLVFEIFKNKILKFPTTLIFPFDLQQFLNMLFPFVYYFC